MSNITFEQYSRQYIKTLLKLASQSGPDTAISLACLLRAETVMDFIEAYQEYQKKENEK